jgi:hypothetical protein
LVYCAVCSKECGFIKNDNPKKEEIYGVCKTCAKVEEEEKLHKRAYGDKAKPEKGKGHD